MKNNSLTEKIIPKILFLLVAVYMIIGLIASYKDVEWKSKVTEKLCHLECSYKMKTLNINDTGIDVYTNLFNDCFERCVNEIKG